MPKNVQIPFDLFLSLIRYHYLGDDSPDLPAEILKGLEDKLEAMVRHDLYSTYSNKELSDKEREAAKRQYLDRVGIRDSFRWKGLERPQQPE